MFVRISDTTELNLDHVALIHRHPTYVVLVASTGDTFRVDDPGLLSDIDLALDSDDDAARPGASLADPASKDPATLFSKLKGFFTK